jgi:hypothetical protein
MKLHFQHDVMGLSGERCKCGAQFISLFYRIPMKLLQIVMGYFVVTKC